MKDIKAIVSQTVGWVRWKGSNPYYISISGIIEDGPNAVLEREVTLNITFKEVEELYQVMVSIRDRTKEVRP